MYFLFLNTLHSKSFSEWWVRVMGMWWESDTTKLAHNACHNEAQSCRFLPFDVNFALICGPVEFRIAFFVGLTQKRNNKARKSVTTPMQPPEKMRMAMIKKRTYWDLEKNKDETRRTIVESSWVFFFSPSAWCVFLLAHSQHCYYLYIILSSVLLALSHAFLCLCVSPGIVVTPHLVFTQQQQQKPPLWNWIFVLAIVMRAGN